MFTDFRLVLHMHERCWLWKHILSFPLENYQSLKVGTGLYQAWVSELENSKSGPTWHRSYIKAGFSEHSCSLFSGSLRNSRKARRKYWKTANSTIKTKQSLDNLKLIVTLNCFENYPANIFQRNPPILYPQQIFWGLILLCNFSCILWTIHLLDHQPTPKISGICRKLIPGWASL